MWQIWRWWLVAVILYSIEILSRVEANITAVISKPRKSSNIVHGLFNRQDFLVKTIEHENTEISLHVLAYNLTHVRNILGFEALIGAIRALICCFNLPIQVEKYALGRHLGVNKLKLIRNLQYHLQKIES